MSLASAVPAHYMWTMNLAPGKSDLRFKWVFIQKHRCYLEIITKDSSYAFNKWPWWKLLSREGIFSGAGCSLQVYLNSTSLVYRPILQSSLSWDKMSSCLCTSFRFLAPLANYSICLLRNYFPQFPAYSWYPNITTCFLLSALFPVTWQHTHLWWWLFFAVKRCNLFTTHLAFY